MAKLNCLADSAASGTASTHSTLLLGELHGLGHQDALRDGLVGVPAFLDSHACGGHLGLPHVDGGADAPWRSALVMTVIIHLSLCMYCSGKSSPCVAMCFQTSVRSGVSTKVAVVSSDSAPLASSGIRSGLAQQRAGGFVGQQVSPLLAERQVDDVREFIIGVGHSATVRDTDKPAASTATVGGQVVHRKGERATVGILDAIAQSP
jgi:hypothetical protein